MNGLNPTDRTRMALGAIIKAIDVHDLDDYGEDYGDLMHSFREFAWGALRFIDNQGIRSWSDHKSRPDLTALEDFMFAMGNATTEPIVSLITMVQFWEDENVS